MTESKLLNFNKVFANINSAIDNNVQDLLKNSNLPAESFSKWKEKVLNKNKTRIKKLMSVMKQHQTKPVLWDDKVETCLNSFTYKICYCCKWQSC